MRKEGKFSDVPLRVKTWVYIITIFGIALIHPISLLLFVVFLAIWGQRELFSFAMLSPNYSILFILGTTIIQLISLPSKSYGISMLFCLIYFLLVGIFISIRQKPYLLYYIVICIYIFSISSLWYIGRTENGYKLLILLVVPIELNDVFQYLSGKLFGKRKIVPQISPNKTIEGLIGGIICTMLVFSLFFYLLGEGLAWWQVILLGIVMSTLGFAGDVFFSYIKRKANVKDTGTLLPGHGGLLDRVDSLLFTAPLFYFIIL